MKTIAFIALFMAAVAPAFAQQEKEKRDTVRIILGDESITLPVPRTGNKVTVNLEDSSEIIQISIGRMSRFRTPVMPLVPAVPLKHTRWFNEVELGMVSLGSIRYENRKDTAYSGIFTSQLSGNYDRVSVIRVSPKSAQAGFSLGFTIKEKRRSVGDGVFDFVTGTRFRYSRYVTKGDYEVRDIKTEMVNGSMKYYPDSVFASKSGEYRASTSSLQLLFPFMAEKEIIKDRFRLAIGVNLALNINTSRMIASNGEDLKRSYMINYTGAQILQLLPVLRGSFGRSTLQVSLASARSRYGFGAGDWMSGRLFYIGYGYKLY